MKKNYNFSDLVKNLVIIELIQGNFHQILKNIQIEIENVNNSLDVEGKTNLLLFQALIFILQGNVKQGLTLLNTLKTNTTDIISKIKVNIATYEMLGNYLNFNFFPGGSGANCFETTALSDQFKSNMEKLLSDKREGMAHADRYSKIESRFIIDFLCNTMVWRTFINQPYTSEAILNYHLNIVFQAIDYILGDVDIFNQYPSAKGFLYLFTSEIFFRVTNYEKSTEYLTKARDFYTTTNNDLGLALCDIKEGDYECAPLSSPIIWNYALRDGTWNNELDWNTEVKEFCRNSFDVPKVRLHYEKAFKVFNQSEESRGKGFTELRFAFLSIVQNDFKQAKKHLKLAIKDFSETEDIFGLSLATIQLELSLIGQGNGPFQSKSKAIDVGIWGKSKGSLSYAIGLGLFINRESRRWLLTEGDFEKSLLCSQLALDLYFNLDNISNKALTYGDIASTYSAIGNVELALINYEKSFEILENHLFQDNVFKFELYERQLTILIDILRLHQQKMDIIGLERTIDRLTEKLNFWTSLSTDLTLTNPLPGLISLIKYSMDIVGQFKVELKRYQIINGLKYGRLNTAKRGYEEGLKLIENMSDEQKDLLSAIIHADYKNYREAYYFFTQYIALGGANIGVYGEMIDYLSTHGGEFEVEKQKERNLELGFTFLTSIKRFDQAKENLEQLEALAGKNWFKQNKNFWESLHTIAKLNEGLNQPLIAYNHFQQAIEEIEKTRNLLTIEPLRKAFAIESSSLSLYNSAVYNALNLYYKFKEEKDNQKADYYLNSVFRYIESSKARNLLDSIVQSLFFTQFKTGEILYSWRKVLSKLRIYNNLLAQAIKKDGKMERIMWLKKKIEKEESELRSIEQNLHDNYPNFLYILNPQSKIIALLDLFKKIPEKSVIIQYYFMENYMIGLAYSKKGIINVYSDEIDEQEFENDGELIKKISFENQVTDYIGAIAGKKEYYKTHEQIISNKLLDPFKNEIESHEHIIFVPHSFTHKLPFHVLLWNNEFLIKQKIVSYLPNISIIQFLESEEAISLSNDFLLIGNPLDMSRKSLGEIINVSPLPYSGLEASIIASKLPNNKLLLKEEATKDDIIKKIGDFSCVHFATHCMLNSTEPLLTSILTANGEGIALYEFFGLRKLPHSFVLSACNTAVSETTEGDDLVGLAHGLLSLGIKSVVASLWEVNDISTALLMNKYYDNIIKESTPKEALKKAQKNLIEMDKIQILKVIEEIKENIDEEILIEVDMSKIESNYNHPYFWAPFIVFGF